MMENVIEEFGKCYIDSFHLGLMQKKRQTKILKAHLISLQIYRNSM